jgi:hypothetical protein
MAANRRASEFRHRASKRKPFFDTLKCQKCPSKPSPTWNQTWIYEGADSRIRTDDLLITNQLLYQLSYAGNCFDKRCSGRYPNVERSVYHYLHSAEANFANVSRHACRYRARSKEKTTGLRLVKKEGSRLGKRKARVLIASLAFLSSRSHRHDFIAQFASNLFAIAGSNFWERKRTFRADFAFAKKIQKMRQQCHVPPVADLSGDGTIVERIFDSGGGDRTVKLYS